MTVNGLDWLRHVAGWELIPEVLKTWLGHPLFRIFVLFDNLGSHLDVIFIFGIASIGPLFFNDLSNDPVVERITAATQPVIVTGVFFI